MFLELRHTDFHEDVKLVVKLVVKLTMTGFLTILRRVPTLTLRHSRMMLPYLLDCCLGFLVFDGH